MSPFLAWNVTGGPSRSTSQIHTTSGSGGCRSAVAWVAVSAPNSGTVEEAAQSREGSMDTKWIATVSPGSAPST